MDDLMEVDLISTGISEENTLEVNDVDGEISNFEVERCGICMDIIIDRGLLDCCQHWFCFVCIDNWATITNLCPLCQNEFQLITCVPVYDTIGNNRVDEDSFSRDDDWSIEGKSSTLSFPSYYIDENAVVCLDGDGCKIRTGLASNGEDLDLDTSIACDSCDIWYHAFCVGFDTEGTSESTWLCPRCLANEQQSSVNSPPRINEQSHPEIVSTECLDGDDFSRKLSISVADDGETAIVISMVGGKQINEEKTENFFAKCEIDKDLKTENDTLASENLSRYVETPPMERTTIQPILEARELELSLSRNCSFGSPSNLFVASKLKTSCADETMSAQSSSESIRTFFGKLISASHSSNRLSKDESILGCHLGLAVGSLSSVSDESKNGSEDRGTEGTQQLNPLEDLLLKAEESLSDTRQEATGTIGKKRKHKDCRDQVDKSHDDRERKAKFEVTTKRVGAEGRNQLVHSKNQTNPLDSCNAQRFSTMTTAPKEGSLKRTSKKDNTNPDIMGIVRGTNRRPSKRLASPNSGNKSSEERDNMSGLRVKKIMRRDGEDKDSSMLVQELRKEIREAVRNKSAKDFGENLFDPKLLAAFRAAIAGPKAEPEKNSPALAIKVKKSILQKGKIRDSLTKKIYGTANGRRKRAWDRECEVEFWKHRCIGAAKPEKIETLKSVLGLLRKNSESLETKLPSGSQPLNPILSRLYLADTSVFPRKDDIKPLSALKPSSHSEQNKGQLTRVGEVSRLSLEASTINLTGPNKITLKVGVSPIEVKGNKFTIPTLNAAAASSKVNPSGNSDALVVSPSVVSKVKPHKEVTVQSNDIKRDKRKWALEVLARKSADAGRNMTKEKEEDIAVLKGNYPLLAQLPIDMRLELAPSRHNKIPISVRQTQLYRLAEHFLRKANIPVMRRTGDTELAIADAVNIEKAIADKSNSKLVYLNLCSQEILHRSDNSKSNGTTELDPSSLSEVPSDRSEQVTIELVNDPVIEEALKNAGLLSDSPPTSPSNEADDLREENDPSTNFTEEGPDNVIENGFRPDLDIYGDFEYDLEDEDYISAGTKRVSKTQEGESKMKVVFSTLQSERSNNATSSEDFKRLEAVEWSKDAPPPSLLDNPIDVGARNAPVDNETADSSLPLESLLGKEGEEPSLAECEELYGPDRDTSINNFPEEAMKKPSGPGLVNAETEIIEEKHNFECNGNSVSIQDGKESLLGSENQENVAAAISQNSSSGETSPKPKEKCKTDNNKHSESMNSVSKKVVAYIKEHIRPLCKSGVITAEQYKWAVAKTTDKVMKYHSKDKNANFLIKEGEKVKKLAIQYVEAAQQKGKMDQ